MKKVISTALAVLLTVLCGCNAHRQSKKIVKAPKSDVTYTVALNPSVMFSDGEVESLRNSAAASMPKDIKAKKDFALYSSTPWQWICRKNDGWSLRALRCVSTMFENDKKSPYSYKLDDEKATSLSVYDSAKMKLEGVGGAPVPESGIILTFKGGTEEAIRFTADKDCDVILSDRTNGGISLVGSVTGHSTDFTVVDGAKTDIITRIYKNGRIYWQEILNGQNGNTAFPSFEAITLKPGDSLIISFEATNDTENIVTGNCDLPSPTKTVERITAVKKQVSYQTEPPEATEIPFVNKMECGFVMLYPKEATKKQLEILNKLHSEMEKRLGVMVTKMPDSDYLLDDETPDDNLILFGDTKFKPSEKAINDIKSKRNNNISDFIIRQTGSYLVISAVNDIGLSLAADFFLNNYCRDDNSVIRVGQEYISSEYNAMKNIKLGSGKISEYRLVISSYASFMEVHAAESFALDMAKTTGGMPSVGRDTDKEQRYEIIVGNTLRNAPKYMSEVEGTASDKYKISVGDAKAYVTGDSTAAINAGLMRLYDELNKNTVLKSGTEISGKYNGGYSLSGGYKMVWSDEFNGDTLGKTWINTKRVNSSVYGGKCYTVNENSYVSNGTLVQKLSRDGKDFKEAEIDSQGANAMRYKYGYMEFRVKLASAFGSWGAMWLLGNTGGYNYGEIDAFENFGKLDTVKSNLHIWGPGSQHENVLGENGSIINLSPGTTSPEPFYKGYHTIGVNWQRGRFDFYVDGTLSQSFIYDPEEMKYSCYDNPFYLILSHWGGHDEEAFINTGCILPNDFTETEICYDWIRIYQRENDGSLLYVKK